MTGLNLHPATADRNRGTMEFALAALVIPSGLALGSFLNVVVSRVPLGRSIVTPGSACRSCASPIAWYDNIPVVSWLMLRGRCRACHEPISPRYLFVELLMGSLFGALTAAGWQPPE